MQGYGPPGTEFDTPPLELNILRTIALNTLIQQNNCLVIKGITHIRASVTLKPFASQ